MAYSEPTRILPCMYWVINLDAKRLTCKREPLCIQMFDIIVGVAYVLFISAFSSTATLRSRGLTQKVRLIVTVRYIYCSFVVDHAFNMYSRFPSLL